MLKCLLSYQSCKHYCVDGTIQSYLPDYFARTSKIIENAMHALQRFLSESTEIAIEKYGNMISNNANSPPKYISENHFLYLFQRYCNLKKIKIESWTEDYYMSIFKNKGINVVTEARNYPPNLNADTSFVLDPSRVNTTSNSVNYVDPRNQNKKELWN
jgi:hypothetical protein